MLNTSEIIKLVINIRKGNANDKKSVYKTLIIIFSILGLAILNTCSKEERHNHNWIMVKHEMKLLHP